MVKFAINMLEFDAHLGIVNEGLCVLRTCFGIDELSPAHYGTIEIT